MFAPDQAPVATAVDGLDYSRTDVVAPDQQTSLLRQHLEDAGPAEAESETSPHYGRHGPAPPFDATASQRRPTGDHDGHPKAADAHMYGANGYSSSLGSRASIFASGPPLASPPLVESYGSHRTYGTLSDADRSSMVHAGDLWRQQQAGRGGVSSVDDDHQPILVKEVEQDGKIVLAVEGQSTLPQTIFNSIKCVEFPSSSNYGIVSHSTLPPFPPFLPPSTCCSADFAMLSYLSLMQRAHRRRPPEPSPWGQVCRLDMWHDNLVPVRRCHGIHGEAPSQVHGPGS